MELYKKYRPKSLDAVVGNEATVESLRNMLQRGTLPHCLLFHGPSGCGKTTMARIVANELKCHKLDYVELNSSSFRGIDTVRDISAKMNLSPVGPCRVYLIDECHKWTNDAQNAALKILEDTPGHVYFLLCTTEPNKLIKAVMTRCCEMPVRALTFEELEGLARRVAKRENLQLAPDAVEELAAAAQGSARTLLVLLDKIGHLPVQQQAAAIEAKAAEENEAIELCRALLDRKGANWKKVATILGNLKGEPESVRHAVLGYARTVLLKRGDKAAYFVIDAFREPFFNTGAAGLAHACYTALFGE